ncbi:MAG: hypothetical protein ACAH17_03815 [Candidatus Paceibacterota bacterium]
MKKKSIHESATEEELITARAIFYAGRKFGSTKLRKLNNKQLTEEEKKSIFTEVYDLASSAVTGKKYDELPLVIRSVISHLHGFANDFRSSPLPDVAGPSRLREIEEEIRDENYETVVEAWFRALINTKDPEHFLHPEDDQAVMKDLEHYVQEERAFGPFTTTKKHR